MNEISKQTNELGIALQYLNNQIPRYKKTSNEYIHTTNQIEEIIQLIIDTNKRQLAV